jgi:hypothetical protein
MSLDAIDGLSSHLKSLLGQAGFVKLCQAFGGTRAHVPKSPTAECRLARAIGIEAARKMADAFGGNSLRIPLARVDRALHYREQGLSHADIARKLGITENGVLRLFKRQAVRPPTRFPGNLT